MKRIGWAVVAALVVAAGEAAACSCPLPTPGINLLFVEGPDASLPTNVHPFVTVDTGFVLATAADLRLSRLDAGDDLDASVPLGVTRLPGGFTCGGFTAQLAPPGALEPNTDYRLWVSLSDGGFWDGGDARFHTGAGPDTVAPEVPEIAVDDRFSVGGSCFPMFGTCGGPSSAVRFSVTPTEPVFLRPIDVRYGDGAFDDFFVSAICNERGSGVREGHHDMQMIATDMAGNHSAPKTVSFDFTCAPLPEECAEVSDGGTSPLDGSGGVDAPASGCSCDAVGVPLVLLSALGLCARRRSRSR